MLPPPEILTLRVPTGRSGYLGIHPGDRGSPAISGLQGNSSNQPAVVLSSDWNAYDYGQPAAHLFLPVLWASSYSCLFSKWLLHLYQTELVTLA